MGDVALLIVRATVGGLVAGHGAQKLFGWFGGPGLSMATVKAHWGKPFWVTAGGAELPVTNMAVALAIALAGSGRYSLDAALGLRVPPALGAVAALAAAAGVATGAVAPAARPAAQASEGAA